MATRGALFAKLESSLWRNSAASIILAVSRIRYYPQAKRKGRPGLERFQNYFIF